MTIKFLVDHRVDGSVPPESFKEGEVVEGRSAASELHFVRRGLAAYLDEKTGDLFNHEGQRLVEKLGEAELVDGTQPSASSNPVEVATTAATVGASVPAAKKPAKK